MFMSFGVNSFYIALFLEESIIGRILAKKLFVLLYFQSKRIKVLSPLVYK